MHLLSKLPLVACLATGILAQDQVIGTIAFYGNDDCSGSQYRQEIIEATDTGTFPPRTGSVKVDIDRCHVFITFPDPRWRDLDIPANLGDECWDLGGPADTWAVVCD